LTPLSGDPDLYVWGADEEPWPSNNVTGNDEVTFEAPDSGTYQIEVHGYREADYRLSFGVTNVALARTSLPTGSDDNEKPHLARPVIPVEPKELGDLPIFYDVDFAEPELNYIYLPMTVR
jgi:hypothetical protein